MHRKPGAPAAPNTWGIHVEQDRMTSLDHTRYLITARGFTHIEAFGEKSSTAHNKLR